jgi:hypothetical protein
MELNVTTRELLPGDTTLRGVVKMVTPKITRAHVVFEDHSSGMYQLDETWRIRRDIVGKTETSITIGATLLIHRIQVLGSQGDRYIVVTVNQIPVACTCPDFNFRGHDATHVCKHMTAMYVEDEVFAPSHS